MSGSYSQSELWIQQMAAEAQQTIQQTQTQAGPVDAARPILPRRTMSVPRVHQIVRQKPYTRRKSSSAQTFTNAHELALWASKRRSSQSSNATYPSPPVQMTPIPMVQDYLLPTAPVYPSSDSNATPPPLSPAGHSGSLDTIINSIEVPLAPRFPFTEGVRLASMHATQNMGLRALQTAPGLNHLGGTTVAAKRPDPAAMHVQHTPNTPNMHTTPRGGGTMADPGASLRTGPMAVPGPSTLVGNPEPQWPQDVVPPNSVAPFIPYGPYPSGPCVWYYYDPDNSPMPPPPMPSVIDTAPANVKAAPTAEPMDPFPGALTDAKGWFLLDLKTNLPFYVPFDPAAETPESSTNPASPTAMRRSTSNMSVPQTVISPSSSEVALPSPLGTVDHSASTPGSAVSSDSDFQLPTISPALYYTNPAHMSALFKRRQGSSLVTK